MKPAEAVSQGGPLAGVLVVEVANWIAAPCCGAILADLGATVVKVEAPSGDSMRYVLRSPRTAGKLGESIDVPYQVDNRGKMSICVDLNSADGQSVVRRLAAKADVFTTNLIPKRLAKFGLDPPSLMRENPALVYASLSGWGLSGPDVDKMAFDTTAFFARGGVNHALGMAAHNVKPRAGAGDHQTGMAMLAGILAALHGRERTGKGTLVEASLIRTATWNLATDLSSAVVDGEQSPPYQNRPMMHTYLCSGNRHVQVAMPFTEAKYWPRLCSAVGKPAWCADGHPYAKQGSRNRRAADVIADLAAVFATAPMAEWLRRLDAAGCIAAPVATLAEVCRDPQVRANGAFATVRHPVGGEVETVAAPFVIHGAAVGPRGPAPDPGQHTDAVLRGTLGLDESEVQRLHRSGAVGFAPAPGTPLARWASKLSRL